MARRRSLLDYGNLRSIFVFSHSRVATRDGNGPAQGFMTITVRLFTAHQENAAVSH
jgi:hypothetical protein